MTNAKERYSNATRQTHRKAFTKGAVRDDGLRHFFAYGFSHSRSRNRILQNGSSSTLNYWPTFFLCLINFFS